MDLGLIIGFIGTWAIILVAMLLGGSIMTYVDVPSVIMIFGGSITVVLFCFPMGKVKGVFGVGLKALFWKSSSVADLIDELVGFAEIARRDGILSLESKCREIEDPFIVQGLQMAVDGTDPELIEQVLMNDLDNLVDRHEGGKALFDAMTKYAPAIGMIGTLVGLVAMLADLSDPSAIGAGLAVALLTTLYGAMVANAFSGPLADRLGRRSAEELLYKTIILKGVMSIQQGDNPRVVEQKLKTFLPPSERKAVEEAA
ncbi:motility protein A [Phycisphaera mikurensis]|uniref:Chemotaxis protein MotA n=1 Tax=Phycisphaera mikurensis (strain NBRC 102666 / KCTC 22515 / FYK2301M01) TaxID=1142394 RepID=I0IF82_PHYMF|nr:MotA/TolQ/ExbB proton channel family protein [Phycisphaera mikurensis]MBB6440684.1 chemotaxis protein MotA [Phycisphaera mikurensis]BAM03920.1 chemotaxis protein MotA [Phycisphaera mikurensis NBRC 102666]